MTVALVLDVVCVARGYGFIGSAFIRRWLDAFRGRVLNLDKLTYAGSPLNLRHHADSSDPRFEALDMRAEESVLRARRPAALVNFAAQTHVDRSIPGPSPSIQTNVVGTQRLLEAGRQYWYELDDKGKARFRFLHVSTDEVYGSLEASRPPCVDTAARPSSSCSTMGSPGDTGNVSAHSERTNLDVVGLLCDLVDEARRPMNRRPQRDLMTRVADRPWRDRSYAPNAAKLMETIGRVPAWRFAAALGETLKWNRDYGPWIAHRQDKGYA